MNGDIFEEVYLSIDTFKYLWATINKYGTSEAKIRIRIATSTSALIRLKNIYGQVQKLALKQN